MQQQWKLGCLTVVLIFILCVSGGLWYLLHSTGPVSLSGFDEHYGHAYYAELSVVDGRTYFEGSVDDLVKCLQAEVSVNFDSREAATYLEYLLEQKGYEANIVVGEGSGEIGIRVYDELRDDWVLWQWGTQSLTDFAPVAEGSDGWSDWTDSREYQDIYEVKEGESINSFAWWNSPQADELDAFAQSTDYLPPPGFTINHVDPYVDDDSWGTVEGELKAHVEVSYVMNRYGDYESAGAEIQLKIYDDDKKLLERSVAEDDIYRGTETLLLDEGSHNITLQIGRYCTLAHGDCSIEIHPPSFYQPLEKCTFSEMQAFLSEDTTEQNKYVTDEYNCRNFSCDLVRNANSRGIKAAYVGLFYCLSPKGVDQAEGHAVAVFDTVDQGLVFVEPQNDQVISGLQYGVSYGGDFIGEIGARRVRQGDLPVDWPEMDARVRSYFFAPLDETIAPFVVLSQLGLAAQSEGSRSYVEHYVGALGSTGSSDVSNIQLGTYEGWDVALEVGNPSEYQDGDECWSLAIWRVWDDGVVVPANVNALSIELASESD